MRATLLLFAAGVLFAGSPFSLGEAQASWSFYGNYDYAENDVAETSEENAGTVASSDGRQQGPDEEQDVRKEPVIKQPQQHPRDDDRDDSNWLEKDFDSSDLKDPEYREYLTKFRYVLYYGGFDSKVAEAIIAVKPTLLITNYQAIDSDMRNEFARNNISVIAYLPIHWTDRSLESTLDEARDLLTDGADGLFIDEASTISTDWEFWYHGRIYETAKEINKDAVVVINPGSASISERAMQVADIVCFEHEWRDITSLNWASEYPGWRFMGISSNEFVRVMGYHVGANSAHDDLEEARSLNIAYHYSADHYIWLPSWLDVYGGIAMSLHPVSEYVDLDLNPVARPPGTELGDNDAGRPPTIANPDDSDEKDTDEQEEQDPDPPRDDSESPEDDNGKDDYDPDQEPAPKENEPPRALAGKDQSLVIDEELLTVKLDGQASVDPDSEDALSFYWDQIEGLEVDLKKANSAIASFVLDDSFFTDGSELELKFELTVRDSDGAEDSDSVTVQVTFEKPLPEEGEVDGSAGGNKSDSETDPKDVVDDAPAEESSKNPSQRQSNSTGSHDESDVLAKDEQAFVNSTGAATP